MSQTARDAASNAAWQIAYALDLDQPLPSGVRAHLKAASVQLVVVKALLNAER